MGWRYVGFRMLVELKNRTGLSRRNFPVNPSRLKYPSLQSWKEAKTNFFFNSQEQLKIEPSHRVALKEQFEKIKDGRFNFFNSLSLQLGSEYDWITNPTSDYKYPLKHWTQLSDYNKEQGDIKLVWEKSRFSYIHIALRYDLHFEEDQSEWVLSEIESWIKCNPINRGPNYRCSQEISIRLLNWIFVLHYYKHSRNLNEERFDLIMHHIYWQVHHVYKNINFSRILVRNNHAITETLTLYLVGLLFPDLPKADELKAKGKVWFEQEIAYQIYDDGTFLQFSMNYHRVVVQLMTWAILLAQCNSEKFEEVVYDRARKSLDFLTSNLQANGHLPNYGANDGALFFPLSGSSYRDFRPQLEALNYALNKNRIFDQPDSREELCWYGADLAATDQKQFQPYQGIKQFKTGGYYLFREQDSFTMIRCGNHKDRPSQADNLHLDIWYQGENILRDSGSFRYNTDEKWIRFFNGSASHNTVMIDTDDQMEKGPRFVWFHWTQCVFANIIETEDEIRFEGKIQAFRHLGSNIFHIRKVVKTKQKAHWKIEDRIEGLVKPTMVQIWNPSPGFEDKFLIKGTDEDGHSLEMLTRKGWYSNTYGVKEETKQFYFRQAGNYICTNITTKS